MNKQEFLSKLKCKLSCIPKEELDERIDFYDEMIEDRIEEGLSEEEAVKIIGDIDEIATQIIENTPLTKLVKQKIKTRNHLSVWNKVLLIAGFPVWFPIGISLFAVIFSLFVVLYCLVLVLWATTLALFASAICSIPLCIGLFYNSNIWSGLAVLGVGFVIFGISLLFLTLCKPALKGTIFLTRKTFSLIKRIFIKKEEL